MKIYSWNVNGLRSVINKGAFQSFINDHQPDILCLQETKANRDQIEIDLPEYQEYWCSAEKKGYSGTAIFSRIAPLNAFYGLPVEICAKFKLDDEYGNTCNEGRVITVEFDDYYVVSVYTPNAKDDLSRIAMRTNWDPAFLMYVKQLEQKKPVIFCGDLNVAYSENDLARPKENVGKKGFTDEERSGFESILNSGFVDTFRLFESGNGHYTWWTHWANARARNVGWRIDYILVSSRLKNSVKSAQIHSDVFGSDHCPVSITLGS